MHDLKQFTLFLKSYFFGRVVKFGYGIERLKDLIVAFLVVKRGKYSNSFLNTSFLLLVAAAFIAGPTIAQNTPFFNGLDQSNSNALAAAGSISYDPYDNSLETVVANRGRTTSEDYKVVSGDTVATIAKKFGVSADTVRWANNLKTDTIKPGQTLSIPPVTGIVHKVQPGENIYTIAKKYHVDPQNIVNFPFNDYADYSTHDLTAGQTLVVPNGTIEAAPQYSNAAPQFAQVQAGVKGSSNFIWPTNGIITQYPIWYHMALDIANPSRPPVIAADTGTVIFAGCITGGYGCHVIIDHGNGYRTLYGHLSQILVSAGQAVNQGQQVGVMGSTGNSTGTHLHFEIRSGSTLLNPLNFLKQ